MRGTYNVYTAESQVRHGRLLLWTVLGGFVSSRYMAYRLFIKDIKADYTKSAFGIIWDFADPLVLGAIFYFLMRRGIIDIGELGMPRAIYVIYGVLLYQTFAESITLSVGMIRNSKGLISQLRIPPEALILSCIYRVLFFSFIRVIILLTLSLALADSSKADGLSAFSPIGFLKFLALFPLMMLPGLAIGIALSPFNVIYSDVQRAVQLIVLPLRYASPVMWPIPWIWLNAINPIALILNDLRMLATSNIMENGSGLILRGLVFAFLFALGSVTFHLSVPILSHRT